MPAKTVALIPVLEADLRFGEVVLPGNFEPPEQGYSWSVGDRSAVVLQGDPGDHERMLLLEGHPFLHPPELARQRLAVTVNGRVVARLVLDELFLVRITLPAGLVRDGRAEIGFGHPDHAPPARFGGTDRRSLAFRFQRATLLRTRAAPPATLAPVNLAGEAAQLARLPQAPELAPASVALCQFILGGSVVGIDPGETPSLELFSAAVRRGLALAATRLLRLATAGAPVAAEFDGATDADPQAARVTKLPDGGLRLGLHPAIGQAAGSPVGSEDLVARRLLKAATLLVRYAGDRGLAGSCLLNLGDDADNRGLTLCNIPSMDRLPIPDTEFLISRGYAGDRATPAIPWRARRAVAFWRGGLSGCHTDDLARWPRWHLCEKARGSPLLDCAFAGLEAMRPEHAAAVRRAGLAGDYVPPAAQAAWKFQIDIDGVTNAWSALFRKLLSASAVLKVTSPWRHRQWYYERLRPWEHYVPVRSDLADLEEIVAGLRADDARARAIGEAGRGFALAMTYESETAWALPRIETAICAEARRAAGPALSMAPESEIARTPPVIEAAILADGRN